MPGDSTYTLSYTGGSIDNLLSIVDSSNANWTAAYNWIVNPSKGGNYQAWNAAANLISGTNIKNGSVTLNNTNNYNILSGTGHQLDEVSYSLINGYNNEVNIGFTINGTTYAKVGAMSHQLVSGYNNKIVGESNGSNLNLVNGHTNYIAGSGNTIFGNQNKILNYHYGFISGNANTVTSWYGFASGHHNEVKAEANHLLGTYLLGHSGVTGQLICGRANSDTSSIFVVGCGTISGSTVTSRNNAFWVNADGTAAALGDLYMNMNKKVATQEWVSTQISTSITDAINASY